MKDVSDDLDQSAVVEFLGAVVGGVGVVGEYELYGVVVHEGVPYGVVFVGVMDVDACEAAVAN